MPIAAQKTISCTTRGLVRAWYWRIRDGSETLAAGATGPGAAAGGGNGLRTRGAVMAAQRRARAGGRDRQGFHSTKPGVAGRAPGHCGHRAIARRTHDQEGEDDHQRRRAGRVRDRRDQRPAEQHVAEAARGLPGGDGRRAANAHGRASPSPLATRRQARSRSAGSRTRAPRRCAMWIAVSAAKGRKPPSPSPPSGAAQLEGVAEAPSPATSCPGRWGTRCRRAPRSWC